MGKPLDSDAAAAHRHFAAACFNRAWTFIDKRRRTTAEVDEMLDAAHASSWHWRSRPDASDRTRSIGWWQLSRVHALAGEAGRAAHYGRLSLKSAKNEPPFYRGYAHEALARAAFVAKDRAAAKRHLGKARALLAQVSDPEEHRILEKDLVTLAS